MTTEPLVQNAQDYFKNDPLILLAYGGSGTGKTQFAGSFGDRTLIIDLTGGLKTLNAPAFTNIYGKFNGLILPIREENDLSKKPPTVIDRISDAIDWMLDNRGDEFDTIVIDDCANLRVAAMQMAMQVNSDLGKSQSLVSTRKYGFPTPAVQDYGLEMSIVSWFMQTLTETCISRNKNLVVLAHERVEHGKAPGVGAAQPVTKIRPMFTGVNTDIGAFFDYVWYLNAEGSGAQMKVVARTVQSEIIEAKTRDGGVFPERYFNPNYPEIKSALAYYHEHNKAPDHKTFFKRNQS